MEYFSFLRRMFILFFFILLSGQLSIVCGADFYVATGGNDANPGTRESPFRTIQQAINKTGNQGAYIYVSPGRYTECIRINKQVTLFGDRANPASTIIDGNGAGSTVTSTSYITMNGFTITGGRAGLGAGIKASHNILMNDMIITGNVGDDAPAIALLYEAQTRITNSLIYSNTCLKKQYTIKGQDIIEMVNVTVADNAGAKATFCMSHAGGTQTPHLRMYNNIIRNPGNEKEVEMLSGMLDLTYCNIRGGSQITARSKTGVIDGDPFFVDPSTGKYQIFEDSPCTDTGHPTLVNDASFPPCRGTARADMGAYGGATSCRFDQAVRVVYGYDLSGNQTTCRKITVKRIKRTSVQDVILVDDMDDTGEVPETLAEQSVNIYPNPTKGVLKVEIAGQEIPAGSMIRIYNTTGNLLQQQLHVEPSNQLDISGCPAGVYIMYIRLGNETTTWKIIKE